MLKTGFAKSVLPLLVAVGAAGTVIGLAGPASAATGVSTPNARVHPDDKIYSPCTYNNGKQSIPGVCAPLNASVSDGAGDIIPAGSVVEVSCWIYGSGTGYMDYVVWANIPGGVRPSFIFDSAVDFDGLNPSEVGLPSC